jgi:hypothetical protein
MKQAGIVPDNPSAFPPSLEVDVSSEPTGKYSRRVPESNTGDGSHLTLPLKTQYAYTACPGK